MAHAVIHSFIHSPSPFHFNKPWKINAQNFYTLEYWLHYRAAEFLDWPKNHSIKLTIASINTAPKILFKIHWMKWKTCIQFSLRQGPKMVPKKREKKKSIKFCVALEKADAKVFTVYFMSLTFWDSQWSIESNLLALSLSPHLPFVSLSIDYITFILCK